MVTVTYKDDVFLLQENFYRNVRGLGKAVKLLSSERRYTDFPLRKSL